MRIGIFSFGTGNGYEVQVDLLLVGTSEEAQSAVIALPRSNGCGDINKRSSFI